jgi:hypothetical protein
MINNVKEKTIPGGFIIYEWAFEAEEGGKPYYFSISLFSSQMADLLRAVGAQEVTKNKFLWDSDNVIGCTVEFNIVHAADKKGTIREQLSDIKMLTGVPTKQESQDIAWGPEVIG